MARKYFCESGPEKKKLCVCLTLANFWSRSENPISADILVLVVTVPVVDAESALGSGDGALYCYE